MSHAAFVERDTVRALLAPEREVLLRRARFAGATHWISPSSTSRARVFTGASSSTQSASRKLDLGSDRGQGTELLTPFDFDDIGQASAAYARPEPLH